VVCVKYVVMHCAFCVWFCCGTVLVLFVQGLYALSGCFFGLGGCMLEGWLLRVGVVGLLVPLVSVQCQLWEFY